MEGTPIHVFIVITRLYVLENPICVFLLGFFLELGYVGSPTHINADRRQQVRRTRLW